MGSDRSGRAVRAAAIVACCLVFAPSQALAKGHGKKRGGLGPVVTQTASATASAEGQTVSATASCPKGKRAFGGGYSAGSSGSAAIFVHESVRTGQGSWTASGVYGDYAVSPPVLTLNAYVYCRRLRKPIRDVTASVAIPQGATGSAAATCPGAPGAPPGSGAKLIAGGFSYSPPAAGNADFALIYASMASGPSWRSTAKNALGTSARTLVVHAYCAPGIKTPRLLAASADPSLAPLGTGAAVSPPCPARKRLSAGGFSLPSGPGSPLVTKSRVLDAGWQAEVLNGGLLGSFAITAQAVCT